MKVKRNEAIEYHDSDISFAFFKNELCMRRPLKMEKIVLGPLLLAKLKQFLKEIEK